MSPLEIFAAGFSALCVFLAIKRNIWTYPTGIVGTILYFFVFWDAKLFSSAWLQVFFTTVQFYGWWYWLRGDKGDAPPITKLKWSTFVNAVVLSGFGFALIGQQLVENTTAQLAVADTLLFGWSVLAQLGLDRKKLQNWLVWILIDVVSIYVYWKAGLFITAGLYVAFLGLATYGWFEWKKAYSINGGFGPTGYNRWIEDDRSCFPSSLRD